jgi:hypothetical protein
MGYRSDVAMIIVGPADRLKALYTEFTLYWSGKTYGEGFADGHLPIDLSFVQFKFDAKTPHIQMHGEGWKWYDSYLDVQAVEWLWQRAEQISAEEEDVPIGGRFVRTGEDVDDTDVRHFGRDVYDLYEYVDLVHTVRVSFPE